MDNWLTVNEAAKLIGRHRVTVGVWGRNGRVRHKAGVSEERHHRPMWLYYAEDVLDPKEIRTYALHSIDNPGSIIETITHKPWTREALAL